MKVMTATLESSIALFMPMLKNMVTSLMKLFFGKKFCLSWTVVKMTISKDLPVRG